MHKQRGQISIYGNKALEALAAKIELRQPADLETDDRVYRAPKLSCTDPKYARTGRWIADRTKRMTLVS